MKLRTTLAVAAIALMPTGDFAACDVEEAGEVNVISNFIETPQETLTQVSHAILAINDKKSVACKECFLFGCMSQRPGIGLSAGNGRKRSFPKGR